ncbi:hypothetical protein K505DRAFT_2242 [Melanomma pulvis-pyrius CBS 109.77]|uniref:Uncharacterized protein n=1 Tax=Melanomma pulvis-pyrius CBS 109.77 TaxID=1314802 RepID=A0A6A6XK03_9PLEO|nr:hypothetical protein K505DRAFT_2242 [Melanomma pulvis-pyrius CBS 109.77]
MRQNLNIYDVLDFENTVSGLAGGIDLFFLGCLKSEPRSGQQRFFLFSGPRAVVGRAAVKGRTARARRLRARRGVRNGGVSKGYRMQRVGLHGC